MTGSASYRRILRSSAITATGSGANIVIGLLKVKVLAVLLGPAGVGLMGLYQNLLGTAAVLAGLGIGTSGVREVARAADDAESFATVRRTLWASSLLLGLAALAAVWWLRRPLATIVIGDASHAEAVVWIGFGVLLTLLSSSQTALLQGLRRIGDLALVNVIAALLSAVLGIGLVRAYGEAAVVWFVVVTPAASVLVAAVFVHRQNRAYLRATATPPWLRTLAQAKVLLRIGTPFMLAGLLTQATQLASRSLLVHELDITASGYFQAAWSISMTYIGFILAAMSADYYPRLAATMSNRDSAQQLVAEQAEVGLLLAGPPLLLTTAVAPWAIRLLYAESLMPAAEILRWQVVGDLLKVAAWPMGFILVAAGRGRLFLASELVWSASYLAAIFVGLGPLGVVSTGTGFGLAYGVLFLFLLWTAAPLIGLKLSRRFLGHLSILLGVAAAIALLGNQHPGSALGIGLTATAVASIYSAWRLASLGDVLGWLRGKLRGT